ncbi:replication terminator protein [Virgibacillus chiguensis]|uniref:Replication terminator protein n=1 Tax=Virgibacillus chiguensis TaxID=411959 RepID=A0A1M5VID2_9BACI|nr:replication terminator protein [Virgibacillus chiguensis]SHH74981.1 hypothetical protein SAMN05421807_112136 [Virgibacillus chiguensis]
MEYMIDLNEFAEGALAAKVNAELEKVLENIADPNTDPKKNRTITVSIKIHGDEKRDVLNTTVSTKVRLQPMKEVETKLMMGADDNGNIIGKELRSGAKGQMFFDADGDVAQDTGEKVVSFRDQQTK